MELPPEVENACGPWTSLSTLAEYYRGNFCTCVPEGMYKHTAITQTVNMPAGQHG